jgi:hypothetical protein
MTMTYRVTWEIDINADSPRDAACKAQEIQRRPDSTATVFEVERPDGSVVTVDLARPVPRPRLRPRALQPS